MTAVLLVVDAANVVGSRPTGWWRDRAGATSRFVNQLAAVTGRDVTLPSVESPMRIAAVTAVVEGQARDVAEPPGVQLVRAPRSGDDALAEFVAAYVADWAESDDEDTPAGAGDPAGAGSGPPAVVVTSDRGLRERVTPPAVCVGAGWLWGLLDE